jgi:signal transduction histidine kinase
MHSRFLRVIWANLDVAMFAAALGTIGPLIFWWSILGRRYVLHLDTLARDNAHLTLPTEQLQAELTSISERTSRQLLMLTGESTLGGVMLFAFVAALFLIARQRRRSNARMQAMFQVTAHELKTPIAGLRALLQSLQMGSVPPAQQLPWLKRGLDECTRLEHLTETILAYQRAVARPNLRLSSHSTLELLKDVLDHRAKTFQNENVEWHTPVTASVEADADAFRVVLENLLDNARKYGGGKVELQETQTEDRYRLSVRDYGVGFSAQEAELFFSPFSRASDQAVSQHGSGLGLFLSRQLAEAMGGSLRAHSEGAGKGSTFIFELKLAAPETKGFNA